MPETEGQEPPTLLLERIARSRQDAGAIEAGRRRLPVSRRNLVQRRTLTQILADEGPRLTPEDLFHGSGLGEDLIDEFYAELKREEAAGRIKQETENGRVYLILEEAGT